MPSGEPPKANPREIKRCLKRIIGRQLYKLLERTTDPASRSSERLDST
jgi:hypothetical protein